MKELEKKRGEELRYVRQRLQNPSIQHFEEEEEGVNMDGDKSFVRGSFDVWSKGEIVYEWKGRLHVYEGQE